MHLFSPFLFGLKLNWNTFCRLSLSPHSFFLFDSWQASGVTVATNVTNSIEEMRVLKENEERLRVLRFGFCDTATTKSGKKEEQIDVTERVTQKDLNEKNLDAFAYMQKEIFKDKTCAYVLYDCKYDAKETGSKAEMIFIMW